MKHIINSYESGTLSFSDTIDIKAVSPVDDQSKDNMVRIEAETRFHGSSGLKIDRVAFHLSNADVLALIADLATVAQYD